MVEENYQSNFVTLSIIDKSGNKLIIEKGVGLVTLYRNILLTSDGGFVCLKEKFREYLYLLTIDAQGKQKIVKDLTQISNSVPSYPYLTYYEIELLNNNLVLLTYTIRGHSRHEKIRLEKIKLK